jgi:hypothetical protein
MWHNRLIIVGAKSRSGFPKVTKKGYHCSLGVLAYSTFRKERRSHLKCNRDV